MLIKANGVEGRLSRFALKILFLRSDSGVKKEDFQMSIFNVLDMVCGLALFLYGMEVMGYDKVDIGLNKLSFRNSTAVNITDEAHIPNQYIKIETSIDKMALKKDLQAGMVIEGAELVTNRNLQIR